MKLRLRDIKANPFKKTINGGKLIPEQVKKLEASVENLKLMGALPVVKRDNDYCLVYGHNRKAALENKFGKDYEIEVVLHDYDDEKLFRGMVIENLTQRAGEEKEEIGNLVAVREMLKAHPDWMTSVKIRTLVNGEVGRSRPTSQGKRNDLGADHIDSRTISDWLNKFGEAMGHTKITELLRIHDKLDEELFEEMTKTHDQQADESGRRGGDVLNFSQASILSTIEDKKEQKELAKALKSSKEQRVREQRKLVTKYKESDDRVKEKIRKGEQDIANVEALGYLEYKKLVKEQTLGSEEEITKMKEYLKPYDLLEQVLELCRKLTSKYQILIEDFYPMIEDKNKRAELQKWVKYTIEALNKKPKVVVEVKKQTKVR